MNSTTNDTSPISPKPKDETPIQREEGHLEQALDEALLETFPASDPISIDIAKSHRAKP